MTIYVAVGQLAGRGCSSKEKLYREHCEVHEMDGLIEKFCYCSFNLCNTANNRIDKVTLTTVTDSTVLILCDCSEILRKKLQNVTLAAVSPHPFAAASLGLQWRIVGCNDLWCGAGDDDACHDT